MVFFLSPFYSILWCFFYCASSSTCSSTSNTGALIAAMQVGCFSSFSLADALRRNWDLNYNVGLITFSLTVWPRWLKLSCIYPKLLQTDKLWSLQKCRSRCLSTMYCLSYYFRAWNTIISYGELWSLDYSPFIYFAGALSHKENPVLGLKSQTIEQPSHLDVAFERIP